jgi:predicted nucleic acid-binding protein
MIIVSDTSPLSHLAKVAQLSLLHQLYGTVIIPDAVAIESVGKDIQNHWLKFIKFPVPIP